MSKIIKPAKIPEETLQLICDVANKFRDIKGTQHITLQDTRVIMRSAMIVSAWIKANNNE